jgi:hypothetical protein
LLETIQKVVPRLKADELQKEILQQKKQRQLYFCPDNEDKF